MRSRRSLVRTAQDRIKHSEEEMREAIENDRASDYKPDSEDEREDKAEIAEARQLCYAALLSEKDSRREMKHQLVSLKKTRAQEERLSRSMEQRGAARHMPLTLSSCSSGSTACASLFSL